MYLESYLVLILFAIICGFAATVQGAIGIGFPLIATPLLAIITDLRTAILILLFPTMFLNIVNIVKGGSWEKSIKRYWPLVPYSIIGSLLGTQLLIVVSAETFRPLLAAAIILYLNAERVGVGFSWVRKKSLIATMVFGLSAGFLGGTVNVMLPALVIFAIESKMEKTAMIQLFNFCFLFGKLTQGAVFLNAGLITAEVLKISLPLALFSLTIMYAAFSLRNKLEEVTYVIWLRRLLFIMAIMLIVQIFV